eukprot:1732246-Rhodomonas_salina.1
MHVTKRGTWERTPSGQINPLYFDDRFSRNNQHDMVQKEWGLGTACCTRSCTSFLLTVLFFLLGNSYWSNAMPVRVGNGYKHLGREGPKKNSDFYANNIKIARMPQSCMANPDFCTSGIRRWRNQEFLEQYPGMARPNTTCFRLPEGAADPLSPRHA